MTHLPRHDAEEERRDAMALIAEAEEMIARWTKLDPVKRRLVLALVRAMTEDEQ